VAIGRRIQPPCSESSERDTVILWVPRLRLFVLVVTLAMTMAEFIRSSTARPTDLRNDSGSRHPAIPSAYGLRPT